MRSGRFSVTVGLILVASATYGERIEDVGDDIVAGQRAALAANTDGQGYGPQAPRDLASPAGENARSFGSAPTHKEMNLCNIHFHEGAEHRGGQFTTYLGNGNGKGYGTGYGYDGTLSEAELSPIDTAIGEGKKGLLEPGMTIEVHYVHTTAQIQPGPTLGSCLSEAVGNPQLRVETQVMVLVNDTQANDFVELASVEKINGYWQAPNLPTDTGEPIAYNGSTTGPSYNEKGSPFQVSWSVRPNVIKVDIQSVGKWYSDNIFDEKHAHGVRNLVMNPALLSPFN
ncbi:MAG: delta-class carbonic anhydrase [Roseobacter sp.]